jgi:hypothetical protein
LLSGERVKSPEAGPGMTLLGHAGASDRVVALLPEVPRVRSAMEVGAVRERLDLRVHDSVALDEIELYAEVLGAVAASDRPLTPEELDEVLGLRWVRERREPPKRSPFAPAVARPRLRRD